jgi:hypothetical protein
MTPNRAGRASGPAKSNVGPETYMTDPQTFPEALHAERATNDEAAATNAEPQTMSHSERATQEDTSTPSKPRHSPWSARTAATAGAAQRAFSRSKVRLTLLGGVLLLLAAFVVTGSAWTAPLAIVGILTLIVAWFGSRLDGRLVLEWGDSGAIFEFKANINAPEHPKQRVQSLSIARPLTPVSDDAALIETTGTTVEIDIAELKALIARAEAA